MRVNCLYLLVLIPAAQGAVCNPVDVFGPFAFQLTGVTDIAGTPKPTASLGRIVFDGRGNLSGTASATFRGLLLGNPVTGSYEAKSDCSINWKLQDDSGAFQHFSGTLSPDGASVRFQQTDPGGAQNGLMKKTSDTCSAADLRKKYTFKVSGSTTPMQPGDVALTVSASGEVDTTRTGNFQVESDCSVQFLLAVDAVQSEPFPMSMRGFLVEGGKEIFAFQTDPGAMVAAHLTGAPD